MRKCAVFLLLLALLLPAGCYAPEKAAGPLAMNPDGTLGNLRWGMRYAEAVRADSRIVPEGSPDPAKDSCAVEFLGKQWTLELYFGTAGVLDNTLQDGVHRLTVLRLIPREKGSWEELAEPLEAVLGPRNIKVRYVGREWDGDGRMTWTSREQIPQWAWAWESAESLGSRLTDRELEIAFPYADRSGLNAARYGSPLYSVYLDYGYPNSSKHYRSGTALTEAPEDELPVIVMDGSCAVQAELLADLLRPEGAEALSPVSPAVDLSDAQIFYRGEEYLYTGRTLSAPPGSGQGNTWRDRVKLAGAVRLDPEGKTAPSEPSGNLEGYVYLQPDMVFPLWFRWREWDEAEGPEPWLEFSIRKGG